MWIPLALWIYIAIAYEQLILHILAKKILVVFTYVTFYVCVYSKCFFYWFYKKLYYNLLVETNIHINNVICK